MFNVYYFFLWVLEFEEDICSINIYFFFNLNFVLWIKKLGIKFKFFFIYKI